MKTLAIIDTHALLHRCYHALPPFFTIKKEPIGAVYGTASIIMKMVKDLNPDYMAACFDLAQATFRHNEFKAYKANRQEKPDDLIPQFESAKKLFAAFNIKCFEQAGFEADDLIGSITEKFSKEKDLKIIIVTGDSDTLQLVVDDKIVVYTMKKSIQETAMYNEEAVQKRYELNPDQMNDFKGIKGDPSDNIPGVKGIGEIGAIKLLKTFENLENLYQEIENPDFPTKPEYGKIINQKLKEKLLEQKEQAFFSKYLTTIRRDIPINETLNDLKFNGINQETITPLFQEWGFKSLIARLKSNDKNLIAEIPQQTNEAITSKSEIQTLINQIKDQDEVVLFDNGGGLEIMFKNQTFKLSLTANDSKPISQILTSEKIKKVGYDLKTLYKSLKKCGITLNGITFDIKIASWLLNSEGREYSIEKIWQRTFRQEPPNKPYIILISEIKSEQEKKIKEWNLLEVFSSIEMPLIPILAEMEIAGVKAQKETFQKLSGEIEIEINDLEQEIYKLTNSKFNISSPKQVSEILFTKLQIPTKGLRKTPGGVISTQESELAKIKDAHPAISLMLKYRELSKLKSTYIDALPELIDPKTNRIHTNYNQTGTATGRLSSDNPNLQNIPAQGDWAEKIRCGFIADTNKKFLSLDYSQIELRVAASLSEDPKMTEAFKQNKDIHTLTASEVNNVPFNQVTPEMRRQAKTLNFGVLYGMGSKAFSENTGMPRVQAQTFIEEYYHDFVGIKQWQEQTIKNGQNQGYIKTLTGRQRWAMDLTSENQKYRAMAERAAINFPIQGLAADIIKIAMIDIDNKIKELKIQDKVKMILQIHDELIFEVDESFAKQAEVIIKEIMEQAFKLNVPVRADAHIGNNLAETK